MNIDQTILDKAIELTNITNDLVNICASSNWEIASQAHQKIGQLYHEILEDCNVDHALSCSYKLLAESIVEENYMMAETIKAQILSIPQLT